MEGHFTSTFSVSQPHRIAANPSPHFNGYRGDLPPAQMVDPSLQDPRASLPQASPQFKTPASVSPPLTRRDGNRSLQSSPRHPRTAVAQAMAGQRSSPSVSPRMSHLSPRSQRESLDPQRPEEPRSLPSRDVTDANIDSAYVDFILFANPGVPSSTDTSELRKIFRIPPRSDGKSFSIYSLWELIRKLENKELKTWTQLAIDLGVEPPQAEKNQSTQKVQQYAVRLKRWMHAMHVDAFFEYLLGKPHTYYTQVPTSAVQTPDSARDGVPLEEDLALRALLPECKPKRGRRKAEDKEPSVDRDTHSAKRQHLDTPATVIEYEGFGGHSALFPQSAIPWSAFPDDHDPWTAAGAMVPAPFGPGQALTPHPFLGQRTSSDPRWRNPQREFSPAGPYPQSAITPRHRPTEHISQTEPKSAVTPSSSSGKAKPRRRHGPAVSSAWPSSGNPSTGKLRGRPPSNRSTQDGPFSTFPANPRPSEPPANAVDPDSVPTPTIERDPMLPAYPMAAALPAGRFQQLQSKNKLQLQVPQHPGGPVRLATPPTVLVNGETDGPYTIAPPYAGRRSSADFFNDPDEHESNAGASQAGHPLGTSPVLEFAAADIARAFATKLLQAKMVPQQELLSMEDAKSIANQVILQLTASPSPTHIPAYVSLIKIASLLGVGKEFGLGDDTPSILTIKAHGSSGSKSANPHKDREFTLSWSLSHGKTTTASIQIRNLVLPVSSQARDLLDKEVIALRKELGRMSSLVDDGDVDVDAREGEGEGTWKERYLTLTREVRKREKETRRYRRRVLEAVMVGSDEGHPGGRD